MVSIFKDRGFNRLRQLLYLGTNIMMSDMSTQVHINLSYWIMKISRSAARQFTGLCRSSLTRGLEARMATMATIYGQLRSYRPFPLNHVIYSLHMALRRLNL